MITPAQTTYRLNKEIGAVVRPLGFQGTRGTWSIVTTDGVTQINVSRSVMRSVGGGTIFVSVSIMWRRSHGGSMSTTRLSRARFAGLFLAGCEVRPRVGG